MRTLDKKGASDCRFLEPQGDRVFQYAPREDTPTREVGDMFDIPHVVNIPQVDSWPARWGPGVPQHPQHPPAGDKANADNIPQVDVDDTPRGIVHNTRRTQNPGVP